MDVVTRSLTPMAFVASVPRSISFCAHLAFAVGNTVSPPGEDGLSWAWLQSDARTMVARAEAPVLAEQHGVLFCLTVDDVGAAREARLVAGLAPVEISTPFYAPRGEFRLTDPDGYVLMVTHTL